MAMFVRNNLNYFVEKLPCGTRHLRPRPCNQLELITSKTKLPQKNILGMGPKIYNKLPDYLRDNGISNHIFKNHLKKLLLTKTYYSVSEFLNDVHG